MFDAERKKFAKMITKTFWNLSPVLFTIAISFLLRGLDYRNWLDFSLIMVAAAGILSMYLIFLPTYLTLRKSTITVSSNTLLLGEAFEVAIHLIALRRLRIKKLRLELVCIEPKGKPSYEKKKGFHLTVPKGPRPYYKRPETLAENIHLGPTRDFAVKKTLQIPVKGMHSFTSKYFTVSWMVNIIIELSFYRKVREEIELRVLPVTTETAHAATTKDRTVVR